MENSFVMQQIRVSCIRGIALSLPKIVMDRDDIWLSAQVHYNDVDIPMLYVYASMLSSPGSTNTGYMVYDTEYKGEITANDEKFAEDIVQHIEDAEQMYENLEKLMRYLGV